ncbi:hypothetical protein OBBRIDRAFT_732028 [Obba rivulosa]|uniref:Uncharacterized protein n=1 Tax=Obba rivulosa TaxID=1052685 RepID=A0A8E2DIX2_9APHY|nr:hypothetical protein OBBRIDRAFT_732028 [Obba rivulosa]
MLSYMNDNFGAEEDGNLEFYEPYGYYYPCPQTPMLRLWDELRIPYEFKKQVYRPPGIGTSPVILIISFHVDPNNMTVTMTADRLQSLIEAVKDFWHITDEQWCHTLKKFLTLAGHANWSFNVFPLLKPCLSNLYAKIAGKEKMNVTIYLNQVLLADLRWYLDHLKVASGVHLFGSEEWNIADLDFADSSHELIYINASPNGLGLYFP